MLSHAICLSRRPVGLPVAEDFALRAIELPALQPGEVLIRQLLMSVDPAMRPRLSEGYALDQPMPAFALGEVIQSRNPAFPEGVIVANRLGFRDLAISDGRHLRIRQIAPDVPLSAYLSVLGSTGFTAWGGMLAIARAQPGEQVFVSTAAGAVGSIAIQIARNLGCTVAGSVGSAAKLAWLRDTAGIADVFNYHDGPIGDALDLLLPEGIDVYFDNVGAGHLDAALPRMRVLGRIAVCGMIAGYNNPGNVAPVNNLAAIIYKRVTLRGFTGEDFADQLEPFEATMAQWIRAGQIHWAETITDGLAQAPAALIGLLRGENLGKALVRIAGR